MKLLDRYLLKETIPPLVFGVLLYSTLAVVSATIPRMQWIVGSPVADLGLWLIVQLPQAIVQVLPIAMVLAVLISFGRMATESELVAMQAGGITLVRISRAFVLLGLVTSALSLAINQWVIPAANTKVAALYWQITTGTSGMQRMARQNIVVDDYMLYFRNFGKDDMLNDVRIERWDGDALTVIRAREAEFLETALVLRDYRVDRLNFAALEEDITDPLELLRSFITLRNASTDPEAEMRIVTSVTQDELIARNAGGGFEDDRSVTRLYQDMYNDALGATERRSSAILFHRKLSESFTNLALLFLAVPLSLRFARTRGIAFALSLVVTIVWYLFYAFGQLLAQTGSLPVWFGAWMVNIMFIIIGTIFLLWRRN